MNNAGFILVAHRRIEYRHPDRHCAGRLVHERAVDGRRFQGDGSTNRRTTGQGRGKRGRHAIARPQTCPRRPAGTVDVTGTTTITSFGTVAAGQVFILRFASSLTLTHNASTLILPQMALGGDQGGDVAIFVSLGGGAWRCINYDGSGGSLFRLATVVDYGGTDRSDRLAAVLRAGGFPRHLCSAFCGDWHRLRGGRWSRRSMCPISGVVSLAGKDDMGGTVRRG